MKQLILIDGNSLLFRAYFAMRPMVTSKGMHTQGIFAFINMLNKIIKDHSPDYMAVAFDMKEKTFRHEQYTEYKAGRQQTPIELLSEIPVLHKVLSAMNIAVLELPRYEADDIIGTISAAASRAGLKTLVISGDKDELQLVDENVKVLINRKGMTEFDLYDTDAMQERYHLTPAQFVDLKALMGDKSDNIPGISGIGEKKGISLLEKYGTLDNVIANADEIPGKMGENIRAGIESAKLSKWLATICTDAPLSWNWEELKFRAPNTDALIEIYTELEFNTFIRRLRSETPAASSSHDSPAAYDETAADLELYDKIKITDLDDFLKTVSQGEEVFIEAATDASHIAIPNTVSLHLYSPSHEIMCSAELTPDKERIIVDSICDRNYRLCGTGLKRILFALLYITDRTPIPYYDTTVAEYLLDPNRQKYSLDKMLLRYSHVRATEEDAQLLRDEVNERSQDLSDEQCRKRLFCGALIKSAQEAALREEGLEKIFRDIEMPLVLTLATMERSGVTCDRNVLAKIGEELDAGIQMLEADIYSEAGKSFNINSPKQLAAVLFEDMNIPYPKQKSRSGGYSTAADILEKLAKEYRIVENVLEFRRMTKLRSTYIDGLTGLIGYDNRIRPHFMQTVAATGRLSCTEPNLQNIPVRDDYGRLIRKAFVTSEAGNVFTGSDYSQIELRILASLSGDASLIRDFREGKDIHRATAARVFDIPEEKVTSTDRSRAKAVNFGVVYGMSGFGLGERLNISRAESQSYINEYFEKHPAVKAYLDGCVAEGEETRKVRTHYGRLRQIPEFASRKFMDREFAKRVAMNTPIQGTAADIIKIAMNRVCCELSSLNLQSKLILQIHDELIVEGPSSEAEEVKALIDRCMKGAAELAVELVCDIHAGSTWYDLK